MEETNEDILKYRFTGYVLVALQRAKKDYIQREIHRNGNESLTEEIYQELLYNQIENRPFLWEDAEQIPLTPEAVRYYMESQINENGKAALDTLKDIEVLVVFMKIFKQMPYAEIGEKLGMNCKKTGSIYTYARLKMEKGWKKENGV